MHFIYVLLILVFATFVAVFIASDDFVNHGLRYVKDATYSRNDLERGRTALGLAVSGVCFFTATALVAGLVQVGLADRDVKL